MPSSWYRGQLSRFSFIHTVLATPSSSHCARKLLTSPTVLVVKLLYSLKSAPTSVFTNLRPKFCAMFIWLMAPETLQLLK